MHCCFFLDWQKNATKVQSNAVLKNVADVATPAPALCCLGLVQFLPPLLQSYYVSHCNDCNVGVRCGVRAKSMLKPDDLECSGNAVQHGILWMKLFIENL